jgi:hypothetical protein
VAAIDRPTLQSKRQSTRGLEGLSKFCRSVEIGWRGPSLRGGGSRQSYSAEKGGVDRVCAVAAADSPTVRKNASDRPVTTRWGGEWKGPSLRGGGNRQFYSETTLSGATSSRLFSSSCVLLLYLLPSSLSPFLLILSSILCCVAVEVLLL